MLPLDGEEWTPEAFEFFTVCTKNKLLKMSVEESSLNQLHVLLFEEKEHVDICINALLVQEHFAISTGEGFVYYNHISLVAFISIIPYYHDCNMLYLKIMQKTLFLLKILFFSQH